MKQNIIIVDNFYENPYEVRQYALSLDYPEPQEGYTYPGRNSNGTFYTQETHYKFELLLGRKLIPCLLHTSDAAEEFTRCCAFGCWCLTDR